MIVADLRTEDLPVSERFGHWHDAVVNTMMPSAVWSDHQGDFRATLRALDLSVVQVTAMTFPSLRSRRTAKMIRRSDPEQYQVGLALRGHQGVAQVGRDTSLDLSGMTLYDTSRPFHTHMVVDEGDTASTMVVQVPRSRVPLPSDRVDRLLAGRMSRHEGIGALLTQFLVSLTAGAGRLLPSDAPRLGTVLLDMLVALLAHELDADSALPPETRRRTLFLQIEAFTRRHLGWATLRAVDLGAIQVSSMTYPSMVTRRTPKLIRRSDPELYQLSLTLRGAQRITQVGRDTLPGPADLMLYDSSRPFVGRVAAESGDTVAGVVAQVPKALSQSAVPAGPKPDR